MEIDFIGFDHKYFKQFSLVKLLIKLDTLVIKFLPFKSQERYMFHGNKFHEKEAAINNFVFTRYFIKLIYIFTSK